MGGIGRLRPMLLFVSILALVRGSPSGVHAAESDAGLAAAVTLAQMAWTCLRQSSSRSLRKFSRGPRSNAMIRHLIRPEVWIAMSPARRRRRRIAKPGSRNAAPRRDLVVRGPEFGRPRDAIARRPAKCPADPRIGSRPADATH
jgi:hypothetical protein